MKAMKSNLLLVLLISALLCFSVNGAIVSDGLVLHMDAANPGANPNAQWQPVVGPSGGGTLVAKGTAGLPTYTAEGNTRYYNFAQPSSGGQSCVGGMGTNDGSGYNLNFNYNEDFTIEAWYRAPEMSAGSGGRGMIFSDQEYAKGYRLNVRDTGSGRYFFEMYMRDPYEPTKYMLWRTGGNIAYSSTEWHHVTATYDGSTGSAPTIGIYFDGTPISLGTANTSPNPLPDPLTDADDFVPAKDCTTIGGRLWSADTHYDNSFRGDISVVRVYDRSLSGTEVSQNYREGMTVVPEPATLILLSVGGLLLRRRV